jgi:hypothetical protein
VSQKEIGRADFIDDLGYLDVEQKPCNPSNLDQRRFRPSVCLGVDELPAAARPWCDGR